MPFYSSEKHSLDQTSIMIWRMGESMFLWKKKAVFTVNKLHWNNLCSMQCNVESVES